MKFTDILKQLDIPFKTEGHHHCRPGWIQLDCPFCGKGSQKWHLGYSLEMNYLNCWRCGSHPLTTTLVEITGQPFAECKKLLQQIETVKVKKKKAKGKLIIPKGVEALSRPHKSYLKKRGFIPTELELLWKIQGIGITSKLSWRIFIPIFYHGKMVSWTTRSISNWAGNLPRYFSASAKEESMPHKSLLYGEDNVISQTIIITEGPFDVWKIGPGAVATLGTGYSKEQLIKMTNYHKRIICFDSDTEAQRRARKLGDDLSAFPGTTFNVLLDAKDAGSANRKQIERLRKEL